MKKTSRNYVSVILAIIITVFAPFSVFAETTAISMSQVAINVMESLQVNYRFSGDTVIEISSFLDIDNERVEMWRSVEKDGSGELIYKKSGESISTELSNQDYDLFVKLVNAPPTKQIRGGTIGSEINGSQYKHLHISSEMGTIDNSALSQIYANGVGTGASIIVGLINVPAGIAIAIASFIYGSLRALSPSKVIINQAAYEVLFTHDNVYYTHCYHQIVRAYDSGGHLVDTTSVLTQ